MACKADVNCDAGRKLGCGSYCCRLLVRLRPEEQEPGDGVTPPKGFVDKDQDGYCIHFDRDTELCKIWHERPQVCREYTCNTDFLLQTAIHNSFNSIADLVKRAAEFYLPKELYIRVPCHSDSDNTELKQTE
jgi:hypothetical protein